MGQGIDDSDYILRQEAAASRHQHAEHAAEDTCNLAFWDDLRQRVADGMEFDGIRQRVADHHNGKAVQASLDDPGLLEIFIEERDYRHHADPNRTYRRAVAYWDRAEHRMRLEYGVEVWSQPPDCYARFQSGTKVAYGDSIPELRAIAERELPLLVAAIERRAKLAMGQDA